MKIRVIYDPILRTAVAPVAIFDETLKREADQMVELMKMNAGIGLAGNQVGLNKQLLVIHFVPQSKADGPALPLTQICNPRIVKSSNETDVVDEGCLSLPGLELPVRRSTSVVVEAQNIRGEPVKIKAKGLFARALQHEIDHLNGILFTDRVEKPAVLKDVRFAKIVFLGSDSFSLPVLTRMVENGLQVVAVICESDKRSGRGSQSSISPVKTYAEQQQIAVFSPETSSEIDELLAQIKPDLVVLASYGKILSPKALSIPLYGALNLHPSLLPKLRGATPLQTAILDGLKETGVTLQVMSPEVDAGALVAQRRYALTGREALPELKASLASVASELLIAELPSYLSGQSKLQPQSSEEATVTKKLGKEMGAIDWSLPATTIEQQIRAFTPWPGTFTYLGAKRLKIVSATLEDGQLRLLQVQLEGKTVADWEDFKRGYANQLTEASWFSKIR